MTRRDKPLDTEARCREIEALIRTKSSWSWEDVKPYPNAPQWIQKVRIGAPVSATVSSARLPKGSNPRARSRRRRAIQVVVGAFWKETVADVGLLDLPAKLVLEAVRCEVPDGAEDAWQVNYIEVKHGTPPGKVPTHGTFVVRYGGALYISSISPLQALANGVAETLIDLGLQEHGPPF